MPAPLGSVINSTALAVFFAHSSGTASCPPTAPATTSFNPFTVKALSNTVPLFSVINAPLLYSASAGSPGTAGTPGTAGVPATKSVASILTPFLYKL